MPRRAVTVGAIFVVAAFAVLGLVYLQYQAGKQATVPGWVATHDMPGGLKLTASDVASVSVPEGGNDFVILNDSPIGKRISHNISAKSLLSPNDVLVSQTTQVTVAVSGGGPVATGDQIDLYATVSGETFIVGKHMRVEAATGGSVTLDVPLQDSPLWVTLSASGKALTAVRSLGDVSAAPTGPLTLDQVLQQLGGITLPDPSAAAGH